MYNYWGGIAPGTAVRAYPSYAFRHIRCITPSELAFRNHMRSLWEQHVAWTRMAINSIAFTLPDSDAVLKRLLQNAPDMGAALKPFYGEKAAAEYSKLIKQHLEIAAELVKAAKEGDAAAAASAENKWYANADQITDFLSGINPYFPKAEFKKMFYSHLAMTKAEAVATLNGDYTASIHWYDRIEKEALMMADIISEAIIRQFPRAFVR